MIFPQHISVYQVGGCVRDRLLGKKPRDIDWVVVGSNPDEMLSLGFEQVGKSFPVFLHPTTKEEYALARKDKKVGEGYTGFTCEWDGVTLEEDLVRRDLTINSMAQEFVDGKLSEGLIDLFGGKEDLYSKILRATSPAFAEDPLRVLRLARFYATLGDSWKVDSCTKDMCLDLNKSGELSNLTPERVWIETEKALVTEYPWLYFESLIHMDNFPFMDVFRQMENTVEDNPHHLEDNVFVHTMMVLAEGSYNPVQNFAILMHDIAKPMCYESRGNAHGHDKEGLPLIKEFCNKWKIPNEYRDFALMVCDIHQDVHSILGRGSNGPSKPKTVLKLLNKVKFTNPKGGFKNLTMALDVCEWDSLGRITKEPKKPYIQKEYLIECAKNVLSLDEKEVVKLALERGLSGEAIGNALHQARVQKIREVYNLWN